jgi:hypothetical protein
MPDRVFIEAITVAAPRNASHVPVPGVGRPANGPARSRPLLPDERLPDEDHLDFDIKDHDYQRQEDEIVHCLILPSGEPAGISPRRFSRSEAQV